MKRLYLKEILSAGILLGTLAVSLLFNIKMQGSWTDDIYMFSFQQNNMAFHLTDIGNIENQGIDVSYTQQVYPEVSNGFRMEELDVFVTNENYVYFTEAYVERGTIFNAVQVDKKMPLAVINTKASNQLFGNRNCIGEIIYLNEMPYKVIGIMRETNIEEARIYIPYSTISTFGISDLEISQLWCRFSDLAESTLVMSKAGIQIENLKIVQINLIKDIFIQRFLFPFLIMGVVVVAYGCKDIIGSVVELKKKESINKKAMGIVWIKMIGICIAIGFVLLLLKYSWCVPPNYELIGKSVKEAGTNILNFYLLVETTIDNMDYFVYWNLLSLSAMFVNLIIVWRLLTRNIITARKKING